MEALTVLLVVIGQLFALFAVPLVVLVFEVIGEALSLLAQGVFWLLDRRKLRIAGTVPTTHDAQGADAAANVSIPTAAKSRLAQRFLLWNRRIAVAGGPILILTLIPILTANFLFFEATVRAVAGRVGKQSGVTIKFEAASGNLFAGKLRLDKVRVVRRGHPHSDYDLRSDAIDLQFSFMSLLAQRRRLLTRLEIQGIDGTYQRITVGDPEQKKPVAIGDLDVNTVKLKVTDHTPPGGVVKIDVEVDELHIDDYDGQWSAWDILFTSNAHGRIDGHPFEIKSAVNNDEHTSEWTAKRLRVPVVVAYLGAPFNLLSDGSAEVNVSNHWNSGDDPEVDLACQIVFADLKAKVPAVSHPALAQFSKPVVGYLNSHANRLPLSFHVVTNKRAFQGKASLETVGLWNVVRKSATRTFEELVGEKFELFAKNATNLKNNVAKKAGPQIEKAKKAGKKAAARLKGVLKKDAHEKDDDIPPANK